VVGIKPTYDTISRDGIIPLAPSLDHIGIISRSCWDTGVVLKILVEDSCFNNSYIKGTLENFIKGNDNRVRKMILGIPARYFLENVEPELAKCFYRFLDVMESINYENAAVSIEGTRHIYRTWRNIRLTEASELHMKQVINRRAEYSPEVRKMIDEGLKIPAVDYIHSCLLKNQVTENFHKALKKVDVLVTPTTNISAPEFNRFVTESEELNLRIALLKNSIPFNINGFPAINIPVGFDRFGVPVGIQIIGRPRDEGKILTVGSAFEHEFNSLRKFTPTI
jgi:aspartyl-tRNA(Asn)/glutamyl-tRNA(Gln) amidotransferase subunit A